jgi:ubiquinone/menaquinone biosynthesis C-methylase UbiE
MAEANVETMAMHPHANIVAAPGSAALDMGTPEYYALRQAIFEAGQPLLKPGCRVVDLCCGPGDFITPFVERNEDLCRFIMLDPSMKNVRACMDRFHMRMHLGFVRPGALDLNKDFPDVSSRLTLCVSGIGSLQLERREEVLGNVRKHLEKGGALILVEELQEEADCASWLESLLSAGFSKVERIWSSGRVCAWVAKK